MTAYHDEHIARMCALHAEGLSGSQIMAAMNTEFSLSLTRNAVIGKLRRLGLSRVRAMATPRERSERRNMAKRIVRRTARPAPLDLADDMTPDAVRGLPPDSSAFAVTFAQLAEPHCRWPIGDPAKPDFTFCGDTKMEGGPYCPRHHRLAYTRATRQSPVRWAPSWRVA